MVPIARACRWTFAALVLVWPIACGAVSDSVTPIAPGPIVIPAGWHTYSDATLRFDISYPDDYGIVAEQSPPPFGSLKRVRFQDKQLLSSEFVDREPAQFMVEVFDLKPSASLSDWLRAKNRMPAGAVVTAVTYPGAREGLRVQQPQQLAPNEFYYVATTQYVYVLTPLGSFSATMLTSFRLL